MPPITSNNKTHLKNSLTLYYKKKNGLSSRITDIDTKLGLSIGNALEVIESTKVLQGRGSANLTEISLKLAVPKQ